MKVLLLLAPRILAAQCSQCFRTAAAQQAYSMQALNAGILILLVLVLLLMGAIAWMAYRRRDA